ncbi:MULTISPECIES: CRISPR-associated protein Cas4 [unclassified Pantoea]|uniref:CRISPR-associated protein Cas4 n=1 Tax=unclassified Pantoea TaxID=2630326 RepID=UPI001CD4A4A3|nr:MULTISPECIES: CRISPR-associated protein Cas4 [unclassified Pantoea]MCA1176673.1 CRISPR-associated protein Cas4 [Pantoea sp. alder69]MCA1251586.1 CRISPR-associated protein Cas4 [Pantoea sp. alder70]MCA1264283.1 CRISPR-associated protein Cas4 [Pantoea sp. alder81]
MEHKEAAVCILQGVENIECSIGSMMRHLELFIQMGLLSEDEYEKVAKIINKILKELITELSDPELNQHPEFIPHCASCSYHEDEQPT